MRKLTLFICTGLMAFSAPGFGQDAQAIERGRDKFIHDCQPCHGAGPGDDGAPMLPGTHALQLKYKGEKPALLEQRSDLSAEVITVFIRNGVASMPPFRKTEVTDQHIADIAAYLKYMATGR